jgi:hypothetical protein
MFSVAYCNMDKPCELGFSNVKNYLRGHELETYADPLNMINQAFHLYSVNGEKSDMAYNHFRPYFENHAYYMSQFDTNDIDYL